MLRCVCRWVRLGLLFFLELLPMYLDGPIPMFRCSCRWVRLGPLFFWELLPMRWNGPIAYGAAPTDPMASAPPPIILLQSVADASADGFSGAHRIFGSCSHLFAWICFTRFNIQVMHLHKSIRSIICILQTWARFMLALCHWPNFWLRGYLPRFLLSAAFLLTNHN
jgi:hypothetical protein